MNENFETKVCGNTRRKMILMRQPESCHAVLKSTYSLTHVAFVVDVQSTVECMYYQNSTAYHVSLPHTLTSTHMINTSIVTNVMKAIVKPTIGSLHTFKSQQSVKRQLSFYRIYKPCRSHTYSRYILSHCFLLQHFEFQTDW